MNDAQELRTMTGEHDDGWIDEWVKYGFSEMRAYMQRYAKWERWLAAHNRASWSS